LGHTLGVGCGFGISKICIITPAQREFLTSQLDSDTLHAENAAEKNSNV